MKCYGTDEIENINIMKTARLLYFVRQVKFVSEKNEKRVLLFSGTFPPKISIWSMAIEIKVYYNFHLPQWNPVRF